MSRRVGLMIPGLPILIGDLSGYTGYSTDSRGILIKYIAIL